MGFTYGLVVVLIIFEGIIIECEGGAASSKQRLDASASDTTGKKLFAEEQISRTFLGKAELPEIKAMVRDKVIPAKNINLSEKLQKSIVWIVPSSMIRGKSTEFDVDGESIIEFGEFRQFVHFSEGFGDVVKKIFVNLEGSSDAQRNYICDEAIKSYAGNLEELRISDLGDQNIWEKISKMGTNFPKLEQFQIESKMKKNDFKLNSIFPVLKSFKLNGVVVDDFK